MLTKKVMTLSPKANIENSRLLRAPYFLGAPLALALLPKIESGARARALTQN